MNTINLSIKGLGRKTAQALLLSSALLTSACAAIPDLEPAPEIKAAQTYAAQQTFAAPTAEWPETAWWTSYGDPQLNALIAEALDGAPSLAQAEARLRQAEAIAQQVGSSRLPQVSADASVAAVKQSSNNGVPLAFVPQGWNDTGRAALNFSYELDFWGRNRAAVAAATSEAEAARADVAQARLTLSTSVASAYADLVQLYAESASTERAIEVRTRTVELLSGRRAQGLENQGAVSQAEAGRAGEEAKLAAIAEAIALTKTAIAALLGQGPDRGLMIHAPHSPSLKPFGLPSNLQADLIGRRPDVLASRLRAEAAAQRIDVARGDFYPNINLSAVIGLQSFGLDALTKSGSDFGSVGPAISLPIFTGGALKGAYREARAEYDASVAAYDAAITQALHDVADVAVSERALVARLAKTREALAASEDAYRIIVMRYRGGLSNYLEVLSAEETLIANRQAVADLETRAFALDVALVRALGGGFQP
jgi:NodT family efflux transporter outer membrane factor (OMF) lipoprotein